MTTKIYIAVNKKKTPFMFLDEPTRTDDSWTGQWFCNSVIYRQICDMVKGSQMSWESGPEVIQLQMKMD
jgi:hypothetical protein